MAADTRTEHLRMLLDLSPVPMLATELETGRVHAMNRYAERLFLTSQAEAQGRTTVELSFWRSSGNRSAYIEKLRSGSEEASIEATVYRKDGNSRDCLLSSHILADGLEPTLIVSTLQDITEHKQAQEERVKAQDASLRSERRLENVIQTLSEGVVVLDSRAMVIQANNRAHGIFALPDGSLPSKPIFGPGWSLVRTDGTDLPHDELPAVLTLRDGQPRRDVVFGVVPPGGSLVWINANTSILERDELGAPAVVLVSFSDITERKKQDEALRKSEAMYRLLAENSLDMITRHDRDGSYLWASPSAKAMLGFEPEEMIGRPSMEMIHPDDRDEVVASLGRILDQPVSSSVVYRHLTKSGTWIWVESISRAVRDPATGDILELQVSTRDITIRKTAEERYRNLFENLTTGFALHEVLQDESGKVVDYRFLEVNPAYEKLTGLRAADIIGKTVTETLPGVEQIWIETFGSVAITGEPVRYDNFTAPIEKWFETWAYRPAPGQFAVIISDVTERKKQEEELRRSEENYRLLAENSTDVISRIAKDGTVAYVSPSIQTVLGWPSEHYLGNSATTGIHPDDLPALREAAAQARSTRQNVRPIYRNQRRDGSWIWVETSLHPMHDEQGNPDGLIASSRDIDARVAAEQALKEREERLRLVLDATSDGIFDWDIPSGAVHYSPVIFTMLGYEPDEFPGTIDEWRLRVHPDDMPRIDALLQAHLDDPAVLYSTEYRMRTKDGNWKWIMARGKVVARAADGTPLRMLGTHSDITERKLTDKALAESQERFRFLAENSLDVVLRLDTRGNIAWASPSLGTVLDQDPANSIGISSLASIHPDDQDRISSELMETLRTDVPRKAVYRHITRKGKVLWVESIGRAVRDPQTGSVDGILVSTRDITERVEAEEQRRLSEARLREVSDMSQDMLSRHDPDGVCLWTSPACRQILLLEPESLVGRSAFEFIAPEDRPVAQASLAQLFETGRARLQYRIVRPDGTILWAESIWALTRDDAGKPFEIHSSTRDVSEQRKQSVLLEETQRLAHVGGWQFYFDTTTTIWTREMKRIFGLAPEDPPLSLETLKSLLDPQSLRLYEESFERLLRDGSPWDIPLRGRTVDGRLLLTRLTGDCERGSDGRFIAIRGSMQDVTESELLRERFESASRLNQSILSTTEALLVLLDFDGRIVRFNEACQRISGWSETEVLATSMIEALVPDDERRCVREMLDSLVTLRMPSQLDGHWIARDGRRFWISWVNSVILDEGGTPLYVLCTGIDMTAHRATQLKLQETQERWRVLIDTAPEAILILDMHDRRFTQANPAAETLFGISESEIVTLGPLELSPPVQLSGMSSQDEIELHSREALEGPATTFEWTHLRSDGREILCQVNLSRIPSDDHPLLRASILDITEKRKTESVMESLVQRTSSLFGQAFFDALVRDLASLLEVRYAFVARIEPDGANVRTVAFVADGEHAPPMSYPIAGSPYADVLADGLLFQASAIRERYPDSLILDALAAESYMGVPLRGVENQPIGFLVVADSKPMAGGELAKSILSIFAGRAQGEMERHEAELALRRLNSELEQRVGERTAELVSMNRELESFAYSVSHDLRSPLRSINGFAQALSEDYGPSLDGEAQGYLERIRNASRRMSELIDDLLSLSQSSRKALRKSDVDLTTMAREIFEMLHEGDPKRVVEFHVDPDLHAWADPVLIRAVMENLLGNSWKYTLRTEHPSIHFRYEPPSRGMAAFAVSDNGAGFDMAFSQKLFGTFQRLHGNEEFEGNGIGLATVKRILERHGGTIRGHGEIGKGATFVFELPVG